MNHLENDFFLKETEIEIKDQLKDLMKNYEEVKNLDDLTKYLNEKTQTVFKKAFVYLISASEEIQVNSKELKELKDQLKEKEEANQKISCKLLDFKAFLDSFS